VIVPRRYIIPLLLAGDAQGQVVGWRDANQANCFVEMKELIMKRIWRDICGDD
jgi:hypothetical protein